MTTRTIALASLALNFAVLSLLFTPSLWGRANSPLRHATFPTDRDHERLSGGVDDVSSQTDDLAFDVSANDEELDEHATRLDALFEITDLIERQADAGIADLESRAGILERNTQNLNQRQSDDEKVRGYESCVAGLPTQQQFCYDVWF